jgi:ATP-binding cassette subfamily B protein
MSKSRAPLAPVAIIATFKALYLRFKPAVTAQLGLVFGAALLVLAAVGARLAEPWPLKFIFDGLMQPEANTGILMLDRLDWSVELAVLIAAFVAIVLAHSGLTFLSKMAMALAFRRMLARMRSDVFDHILRMSVLRHNDYGKGDLSNRVTVDFDRLRLAGTNNAINLASNVLTMAGMLVIMFWVNWQLALIASISVPLFHLLTRYLMPRITSNARAFRASDGDIASETVHATAAVATVQGLSLGDRVRQGLDRQSEANLALGMRSTILKTVLRQAVLVLFAVVIGLLVWRGALLVGTGAITAGDLIIFMAYLRDGMEKPMVRFSANLAELGRAAASGERLLSLLTEPRGPVGGPIPVPSGHHGAIRFDNVSFGYPRGPLLLDKVYLEVHPAEKVAIIGASGSGKSTLIGLLLRLYDPGSGRICLGGTDLRGYGRDVLSQTFAPAFQNTALFADTIRENLAFGAPRISDDEIWEALHAVQAAEFVSDLSGGLDHRLPVGGGSLSGGQAQKLGLARALLRQAPVLLLDEPTSALDPESRAKIMSGLLSPSQPASVLMITHHKEGLSGFDRVYRLAGGALHPVKVQSSGSEPSERVENARLKVAL